MNDQYEIEAALEAILFVSNEPVPRDRLLAVFEADQREWATAALARLEARYAPRDHAGIGIEEVAGGLRLVTRSELHVHLRRFFEASGGHRLSMAGLETLAIVAYRQPITGPEIQELRGKSSASVIRSLLERRLIRITGRKEVVGRPFLYATTREFLMHFGLRNLKELPPLEEFEEAFGAEGGSSSPGAPPAPEGPLDQPVEVEDDGGPAPSEEESE